MHRLAIQLKLAIEASGYSRMEICERCDIAPAALSKYLNGKMHPRRNVLTRLSGVIPEDHIGALYIAYLLDSLPDGSEKYVTISENSPSATLKENQASYQAHQPLPKELEEAFAYLRMLTSKSPVTAEFILNTHQVMKGVDLEKVESKYRE